MGLLETDKPPQHSPGGDGVSPSAVQLPFNPCLSPRKCHHLVSFTLEHLRSMGDNVLYMPWSVVTALVSITTGIYPLSYERGGYARRNKSCATRTNVQLICNCCTEDAVKGHDTR